MDNVFTHPAISKSLLLGIVLSLLAATCTGIALDQGNAAGVANTEFVAETLADDYNGGKRDHHEEGLLNEVHELFANLMLFFVGMHVAYLFLFKRPLAKYMLFIPNETRVKKHI